MAFVTRSLGHLHKIYYGRRGAIYSKLLQPITRIPLCQTGQLYNYNTKGKYKQRNITLHDRSMHLYVENLRESTIISTCNERISLSLVTNDDSFLIGLEKTVFLIRFLNKYLGANNSCINYSFFYTAHQPKIKNSLTNIQLGRTVQSLAPNAFDNKKIEESKEDAEGKEKRAQSIRMLKYSFTILGVILTFGLSYTAYDLAKVKYDEQGNLIEDEYSNLPIYERIYRRLKRECNYYTKV